MAVYLLSEFLPEICWAEIAEEIVFIFHCGDWSGIRTQSFASNKPTHYILDHGDFNEICEILISIMAFTQEKCLPEHGIKLARKLTIENWLNTT